MASHRKVRVPQGRFAWTYDYFRELVGRRIPFRDESGRVVRGELLAFELAAGEWHFLFGPPFEPEPAEEEERES